MTDLTDWIVVGVLLLALTLSLISVIISLATQRARGPQGLPGPVGPMGAMGERGLTGPKGDPGKCKCAGGGPTPDREFSSGVDRDDDRYNSTMTKEKLYGLPPLPEDMHDNGGPSAASVTSYGHTKSRTVFVDSDEGDGTKVPITFRNFPVYPQRVDTNTRRYRAVIHWYDRSVTGYGPDQATMEAAENDGRACIDRCYANAYTIQERMVDGEWGDAKPY